MARRSTVNKTGFANKDGINHKEAWVCFPCINCGATVKANIGLSLPTLEEAMENCVWLCPECGYEHSILSDIPDTMDNFPEEWRSSDDPHCQGFWTAFFRMATKDVFSYWKHCSKCGRLLPVTCFDQHNDKPGSNAWKPLNRQAECKACKAAINANLNKERTHEQLFEGTINRRIGDLLSATDNKANPKEVFDLFGGKCFKTGKILDYNDRKSWHIDHIMPSKYFWPLTKENAALLSNEANEAKSGKWPSEFYTDRELVALSKITGAPLDLISSKTPIYNMDIDTNKAVEKLFGNVRENSHLPKLVEGLRKVLVEHDLVRTLSPQNQKLLGLSEYQQKLDDQRALEEFEKEQTKDIISKIYDFSAVESLDMAAEPFVPANELTEEQRIDVLRKSLIQMMNHGGYRSSDKTFCKQRHWIAVYRIAADEGFPIDGDYRYFKHIIDGMNLTNCKVPLNIETLERSIKGGYSASFVDWSEDGLVGKSLDEYNDIKQCAEAFLKILSDNRPKR